jgi:energy-coupling factor transport system ATP-binding protein
MIRVENVRYQYPPLSPGEPWTVALDNISFEIPAGGCLAVSGPNNSGKTTLCLAVAGLAPRLTTGHITGQITAAGRRVQEEPPGSLADVVGLVLQDPAGQLFTASVEEEIAWGLENLGITPAAMPERINWALAVTGLVHIPREQAPQTLSGGQQKRLALAAALALSPKVLILDDPSGGLSPLGRQEMISVLRDLRTRQALTLLLASNDAELILALADEMLILSGGRILAQGDPREVFLKSSENYPGIDPPPAALFAAEANVLRPMGLTCQSLEEAVRQTAGIPRRRTEPPASGRVISGRLPGSGQAAIELEHVSFAYRPEHPVLCEIDMSIPAGQFVALTGDNGAGKTTLTRLLIGLLRPDSGRVILMGEDSMGRTVGQNAARVGLAFQNPELQIFNPTVREEVAFGPRNLGCTGKALEEAVRDALEHFDLSSIAGYPPASLSFSARRLVALAAVAAMNTPILVLDEPTVGLDREGTARVISWLDSRHREGAAILLITHDMELAARSAQRIMILDRGRITADGAPRQVFSNPQNLLHAGLEPPFAVRWSQAAGAPELAADLTPQGAARAWVEATA